MIRSPNTNDADGQGPAGSTTHFEAGTTSRLTLSSTTSRSTASTTVAPWMRLSKDPRIVRVSRAFGGKDRHSKVCTVRGLRDRRVRLSVPTAIQLYDLQDRLGLNQPSKAVDWLLDAAKDDIDQLPPLPMMPSVPGSYGGGGLMNHQSLLNITPSPLDQNIGDQGTRSNIWRSTNDGEENQKNDKDVEESDEDDNRKQRGNVVDHGSSSSNNFLMARTSTTTTTTNHPLFFPGLLNNCNAMPNYGFHHWDQNQSSNFPLSHQLASHGFTSQPTDLHNFNVASLPSALSLSTGTTQSYFPSHATTDAADNQIDIPRQFSHHMPSSHQNLLANSVYPSSQSMQRATPQNLMSMITKLSHSSQPTKDQEPPSR